MLSREIVTLFQCVVSLPISYIHCSCSMGVCTFHPDIDYSRHPFGTHPKAIVTNVVLYEHVASISIVSHIVSAKITWHQQHAETVLTYRISDVLFPSAGKCLYFISTLGVTWKFISSSYAKIRVYFTPIISDLKLLTV